MDTLGIIRQIEADAALRAQLRAVLLGDELLALPAQVAQLIEGQREMQAAIRDLTESQKQMQAAITGLIGRQDRMEDTLTQLVQSQREMQAAIRALTDSQKQIVIRQDRMEAAITALTESHQRLEMSHNRLVGEFSQMKGLLVENRIRDRMQYYVPAGIENVQVITGQEFKDLLDELNQKKTLAKEEHTRITKTDIVASAQVEGDPVVLVAEVSGSLYPSDVERVVESAKILQERGKRAKPLVFGEAVADNSVNDLAGRHGVEICLGL